MTSAIFRGYPLCIIVSKFIILALKDRFEGGTDAHEISF